MFAALPAFFKNGQILHHIEVNQLYVAAANLNCYNLNFTQTVNVVVKNELCLVMS